jgi:hypothetical protein
VNRVTCGTIIGGIVVLVVCAGLGAVFPVELLVYLAVGWAIYLYRVVPKLEVSWSGVATTIVCLSLLAVGLHRFLRWLYAAERPRAVEGARHWPVRWTAALLGVVVLMFVAGIAAVGVTHQTAWLATSPEPVLASEMREAAMRMSAVNDMKLLTIALHNYASDNKETLPPHALYNRDGQALLSWRVLILPYVEEEPLFKEFRLDEPWDSPHNLRLLPRMPKVYAPAWKTENPKGHSTYYQVFVGKGAAFEGREGLRIPGDFPDGISQTILIVEAANAVPWTKPADLRYSPEAPLPPRGRSRRNTSSWRWPTEAPGRFGRRRPARRRCGRQSRGTGTTGSAPTGEAASTPVTVAALVRAAPAPRTSPPAAGWNFAKRSGRCAR